MMLLERWVVATVLGLAMPLVSTAAGSSAPQQAGNAQTAQPAKTGDNQDPAKAADSQDPQAAKADDDEDEKPGTSAYDRDTQNDDQDPAKAGDDHPAVPAQAGDDQDAKPAISAYDRDTQTDDQSPSRAGGTQDAKPAEAAASQQAQPNKSSDGQNPATAAEHTVARSPATPETTKQQQMEMDSAALLQLVQELKAEVEKAGTDTLSLAALRKADEIQKLAKNLKERMREQGQASQSKP